MKLLQKKKRISLYILAVFFLLAIFYSYAIASEPYYPTAGWQKTTPEQQGIQSKILADMMEDIKKYSHNIDSVVIIRNGYMVLDAYYYPFSKGQKHIIHSCTKSIMSALIGIAIDKGYIRSVDQPIIDFFPDKDIANMDDLKKSISLENLLMMSSGLECRDSYLYGWKGLIEMRNSGDWAQYVLDLPMTDPPGQRFEYCNGVSYLLSVIIQHTTKMKTLDFARENLFNPLGISEVRWASSPQGIDIGWGEMWLKADDMAKIGLLYLEKGRWDQSQILPASWINESTRGHIDATLFDQYGYQWWVDSAGFYMAVGYKGQFIFVVPDKDMVVVFTSDLSPDKFYIPRRLLWEYIIPAATSPIPLQANSADHTRLYELVKSVALSSAEGFIWLSKEEGMAKDGVFKRAASPAFKFEYPLGSKKEANRYPGDVMRMKTPGDDIFSASVIDTPEGIKIEDFGPKFYAKDLENYGSDIKVISNKEIVLNCGTKAYRTDITWLWNNTVRLKHFVVAASKDGKCIFLWAETWKKHHKLEPIFKSLTFK
jgi:CubicO group peptidase (beta-lactamase class C family)